MSPTYAPGPSLVNAVAFCSNVANDEADDEDDEDDDEGAECADDWVTGLAGPDDSDSGCGTDVTSFIEPTPAPFPSCTYPQHSAIK
jgi:hypothetical protein